MKYFVFVTILCGVLAAVKQCDMPTRPVICPFIYKPVCGTKTDGSKQTYSNYCSACADAKVVSYDDSQGCNAEPVVPPITPPRPPVIGLPIPSGFSKCGPYQAGIACIQIYQPVCALLKDGSRRTQGNGCTACTNIDVIGHVPGECQKQVTICSARRTPICPTLYKPVCGLLNNKTQQTYSNSCVACADKNVRSYVDGPC